MKKKIQKKLQDYSAAVDGKTNFILFLPIWNGNFKLDANILAYLVIIIILLKVLKNFKP